MANTSITVPPGFDDLSVEEQIDYVQALWDYILDRGKDVLVPESHLRLVEERMTDYRRDPSRVRDAFEMLERLAHEAE